MANSVCQVLLTAAPLLVPAKSASSEMGAIVDFWGIVRETEVGAKIIGIDYEAHREMAQHQLELVAEEAREKFQLTQIIIQHRLGFVPVGESSLLVQVGSRHRAAAFQASASVVEELKRRAPIWKHPILEQGAPPLRPTQEPAVIPSPA